jgi:hypothetical protein
MEDDIHVMNMTNTHLKLASCSALDYDVSNENQHRRRTDTTSQLSSAKQFKEVDVPISATTEVSNTPNSLWQSMLHSWIRTYELTSSSGAVPFLLV